MIIKINNMEYTTQITSRACLSASQHDVQPLKHINKYLTIYGRRFYVINDIETSPVPTCHRRRQEPDEELLDGIAGVRFLRNHSPRAEEDTVERHRLHTVLKRPLSGNVRPNTLAITKARASDEGDVRMGSNGGICGKNRLVEVFVRMVAASPLQR